MNFWLINLFILFLAKDELLKALKEALDYLVKFAKKQANLSMDPILLLFWLI